MSADAKRPLRVGILGGTFDPIHAGHLAIAHAVMAALHLDQVIFVPAGDPYLKNPPKAPARQRVEMVRAAIRGEPRFVVSRVDVDRPGPSYSVDTVADLKGTMPAGTEFFFILGADNLAQLAKWREPERLAREAALVCVARPGSGGVESLPIGHPGKNAIVVEGPRLDVSATEIRSRLAAGQPVGSLVPEAALDIIHAHHLYGANHELEKGVE